MPTEIKKIFALCAALLAVPLAVVSIMIYHDTQSRERAIVLKQKQIESEISKVETETRQLKSINKAASIRDTTYEKDSLDWILKLQKDKDFHFNKQIASNPSPTEQASSNESSGLWSGFTGCMTYFVQGGIDRQLARQVCTCYNEYNSNGLSPQESIVKCRDELTG